MTKIQEINNKFIITINKKIEFDSELILNSEAFLYVLKKYLKEQKKFIFKDTIQKTANQLKDVFLLLLLFPLDRLKTVEQKNSFFLDGNKKIYTLTSDLYDYWRNKERYLYMHQSKMIDKDTILDCFKSLNEAVLKLYRKLSLNITNRQFDVYRDLSAGVNASFLLRENNWSKDEYDNLKCIDFINTVIFKPPFISYTLKNKRTNSFEIVDENPLSKMIFKKDEWLCFPILVGSSLAYVYFHQRYLGTGLGLTNLFAHVAEDYYFDKKPDLVVIYGGIGDFKEGIFYDAKNDIYVGALKFGDDIDYFGYLDRLIITTYNIKMLKSNHLPIQGTGIHIELKNGSSKNVILIGDSRTGKSETIEALRDIGKNYIRDMITIFDNAGTVVFENNIPCIYGTEIGAFVRFDKLDSGYVYKVFDRVIFTNPNQSNSRCIMPISSYDDIMKGYPIDVILYANNYKESSKITLFDNFEQAKTTFIRGRSANKTICKLDYMETFFANPFGPLQMPKKTNEILDSIINYCIGNKKIILGEIYTELAINDEGPKKAALELLRLITEH